MELKTTLNRVYRLPGFVYGRIRLVPAEEEDEQDRLEVEVRPRANGRALSSGCGQRAPGYDRLQPRRFQFEPVLGLPTFFLYAMRRVNCRRCGKVKVERVPWADGKQQSTRALDWFLAIFSVLPSLHGIGLNSNMLASLSPTIFSGLPSLRVLSLHKYELTTLPPDIFSELSSLAVLDLSDNQLSSLPLGIFAGLRSLSQLHLL